MEFITDLVINRILCVHPSTTFGSLHEILQVAFGWTNSHMHSFMIQNAVATPTMRMGFPLAYVQLDSEEFEGMPGNGTPTLDAIEVKLEDTYEDPKYKDKISTMYEYDMGDSWEHNIALIGHTTAGTKAQLGVPDEVNVFCLGGQGLGPAEDCGSPPGWEELKGCFAKLRKAGSADMRNWYKNECLNEAKTLDTHKFDVLDVNDALAKAGLTSDWVEK